jgi:serine/threonine protein kinase
MAGVYLAVRADGEFRRQVAIKLVRPSADSQEVLKRFRQERQTLAGLDHPNIVKLLDGGSTPERVPYLVMDYVEGSPIDEYCDSHKSSVEERLRLFSKACEAVQYAHQKQVIHRDLKPSNILVTAEGVPKLLDFGIAKVLTPDFSEQAPATETVARCMTPAYASPEQVRGRPVTPATDIYSLGVVLYELLTGHRPYRLKEDTPAELERAICEQAPEPPSVAVGRAESKSSDGARVVKAPEPTSRTRGGQPEKLRRRLRGDLDNIVLKALRKEPERRYGSVQEFVRDIDRHLNRLPVTARPSSFAYRGSRFVQRHKTEVITSVLGMLLFAAAATILTLNAVKVRERHPGGAPTPRIQSLAVLPLANLSGDPAQEYFSDGMTDALITDLAQIGSLKVISRTSTMRYKKTDKPLPEIARELNVDGIVEGSVQRSGDRVLITAQLIHGPSDKHLWANSYERDLRDVFALEREVTADIAHQVQARLSTQDLAVAPQSRPVNLKALDKRYITSDPEILRGRPRLKGTRIPFSLVLG